MEEVTHAMLHVINEKHPWQTVHCIATVDMFTKSGRLYSVARPRIMSIGLLIITISFLAAMEALYCQEVWRTRFGN